MKFEENPGFKLFALSRAMKDLFYDFINSYKDKYKILNDPNSYDLVSILCFLDDKKDSKQTELIDVLNIKRTTMIRYIRLLSDEKLVTIRKETSQKNINWISLTIEGNQFLRDIDKSRQKLRSLVYKDISESELSVFTKVLNKVINNIDTINNNVIIKTTKTWVLDENL